MSSLLITGTVAYIIVKWRVVLPTLVHGVRIATLQESATLGRNLLPMLTAFVCGGVAAYIVTFQDPLTQWDKSTSAAVGAIVSAAGTLVWPTRVWQISTLQLVAYACMVMTETSSNWVIGAVLFSMLHAGHVTMYCVSRFKQ